MKNKLITAFMFFAIFLHTHTFAQLDCFQAAPIFVEAMDNISYYKCIQTPTGVYHNNAHHAKKWVAAESIDLNGIVPYLPTEFNPYGFQANIDPAPFTVSLMFPANAFAVPLWGKLEYGIALPPDMAQKVTNFTENLSGEKINPYLEWEIKVTATFVHGSLVETRDAFYYKNYNTTYPNPLPVPDNGTNYSDLEYATKLGTWTEQPTSFPFRVRFAPDVTGGWSVKFTVTTPNTTFTSPLYNFNVMNLGKQPPIKVGPDKKYFTQNDKSFIPFGCNMGWPEMFKNWNLTLRQYLNLTGPDDRATLTPPYLHKDYRTRMTLLQQNGANFFRYIMYAPSSEIEYEHLGNYTSRLPMAYEMDKMLFNAEQHGMYIDWNMMLQWQLQVGQTYWDWKTDENNPMDVGYCYQRELGLSSIQDFFTNAEAQKYYKQRLRYIVARWGYSPHVAMFELASEINDTGKEFSGNTMTFGTDHYYHEQSYRVALDQWQLEMAGYLKNTLHCRQLIGPSYTQVPGEDDHVVEHDDFSDDKTYNNPYMDFNSRNCYDPTSNSIDFDKITNDIKGDVELSENNVTVYNKPMVYSEFGASENIDACSHVEANRQIWKMLFSGLGMALHWYQFDHPDNWGIYGKMKQFMADYNLAGGKWHPGNTKIYNISPLVLQYKETWEKDMVRKDLKADLSYLRAGDQNRAIGIITNRTWNYWTASGYNCGVAPIPSQSDLEINPHPDMDVYKSYYAVYDENGNNKLKVRGMKAKKYVIYFYGTQNPLLPIGIQIEWGPRLNLEYPNLASDAPFVLFKTITLDELNNDGTINPAYIPNDDGELAAQDLKRDSIVTTTKIPDVRSAVVQQNTGETITLYPNPNNGSFILQLPQNYTSGNVEITDIMGKTVYHGEVKEKRTEMHFNLMKGVYYLHFMSENKVETLQFIVQ